MRYVSRFVAWVERRLFGSGAAHQDQFYRCQGCHGVVTWDQIRSQGGCRCGARRMIPTVISPKERVRLYARALRTW